MLVSTWKRDKQMKLQPQSFANCHQNWAVSMFTATGRLGSKADPTVLPNVCQQWAFNETAQAASFAVSSNFATTAGSARVEMSPNSSSSLVPPAILRRMRRMILPERVLGRPAETDEERVRRPPEISEGREETPKSHYEHPQRQLLAQPTQGVGQHEIPGAQWIISGAAKAPISPRTAALSSFCKSAVMSSPCASVTKA